MSQIAARQAANTTFFPFSPLCYVQANKGGYASCCSTQTAIPMLRVHKRCWLWVVLLTVFLPSAGAYSVEDTPRSEEGRCRYDLTSIAALSCLPDGVWRPPSQTCCNALLYAIDQVPPNKESGTCCLCRYLKEKVGPPELATTYVMCNGKDKHIISQWSLFPIIKCSAECTKRTISSVDMGTPAKEDRPLVHAHGTGNGVWIAVAAAVFIVMGLICLWYFPRFKAAVNATAQRRTSPQEGDSRAGHRRSVVPSSSAKLKERRFSSS